MESDDDFAAFRLFRMPWMMAFSTKGWRSNGGICIFFIFPEEYDIRSEDDR